MFNHIYGIDGLATRTPAVYDNFDVDNANLSQRFSSSGQQWAVSEAGGQPATIRDGVMTCDANMYASLPYPVGQLLPRISARISWAPVAGGDGNRAAASFTLIGSAYSATDGNVLLNLVHLQVTPDGCNLEVTSTGPSGFVPVPGSPISWKIPCITDGTEYSVAIEFDYTGQIVTVYGPDGSVTPLSVTGLGTVYTPYFGMWQITGKTNFRINCYEVSLGRTTRREVLAPASIVAPLYGDSFSRRTFFTTIVTGTTSGAWFRIGTGIAWGSGAGFALAGRMRLSANDGHDRWNDWEFDCTSSSRSTYTPTLVNRTGVALAVDSFVAISAARLTLSSDRVAFGLDLQVAPGASGAINLSGVFEGYVSLVQNPTIGAVPLGGPAASLSFVNG